LDNLHPDNALFFLIGNPGGCLNSIIVRPPSCFQRDGDRRAVSRSDTSDLRKPHKPFAIEDMPPECLVGAFLEVDEQRYGGDDIRRLYQSSEYPLTRRDSRS
jgi:hypothetical protein